MCTLLDDIHDGFNRSVLNKIEHCDRVLGGAGFIFALLQHVLQGDLSTKL